MRPPARDERVGSSSTFLLTVLLLLLATPRHTAGFSLAKGGEDATQNPSLLTMDEEEYFAALDDSMEDESTDNSTATVTTGDSTTDDPTSTTTDDPTSTTTDDPTSTTTDSSSTDDSTLSNGTSPSVSSSSPVPTVSEIDLFLDTRTELDGIEATMDQFLQLVDAISTAESVAAGGRAESPDHPASWWKLGKEGATLKIFEDFCNAGSVECENLKSSLINIEISISFLNDEVEDWNDGKLNSLKEENKKLATLYTDAETDPDAFKDSIDTEAFISAIIDVKKHVQSGLDSVDNKISNILGTLDATGSVALVATIGTMGGIMLVSLAGVMIYGAVKKRKTKKSTATTPYNKLQGENIPIDGFLSDAPRMNPYAPPTTPSVRSDPYAVPHSSRAVRATEALSLLGWDKSCPEHTFETAAKGERSVVVFPGAVLEVSEPAYVT
ncbi:hypothetical protein GWK47_029200 [Chionoecetes opilio]|uniref:Uncharacterized protein n=1 Tax=Chionoecetes opilio TaxID=41210 RepID=A0A8J5D364_CHIOP|nr:hypothetical protein GWK47_029200 [Chionoecetes opilio]